jgi:IS30 family transposase
LLFLAHSRAENGLKVIEQRKRLGDFEGDTVLRKRRTGGLVTLVDRKSRLTAIAKIKRKKAEPKTLCRFVTLK